MMTGPELKALRERAGLTQTQVADRAGWSSKAVVHGYERNVQPTDRAALKYVVAVLEEVLASRVPV